MAKQVQTGGSDDGGKIAYERIESHDTYVTGIASYKDPEGRGTFALHVSGQQETIDKYAEEARIISMQLVAVEGAERDAARRQHIADLERRLECRENEVAALKKALSIYRKRMRQTETSSAQDQAQEASHARECCAEFDPERDRLIEIESLDELEPDELYFLSFTIDPSVAQGTCDIYSLRKDKGQINCQTATITTLGGNPDLYLYRGSELVDRSTNGPGQNETAEGCGASGKWRLHVHGESAGSRYRIDVKWRLDYNDSPHEHH